MKTKTRKKVTQAKFTPLTWTKPKLTKEEQAAVDRADKYGPQYCAPLEILKLRVVIAKDVIAQVKSKAIIAERGTTCDIQDKKEIMDADGEILQDSERVVFHGGDALGLEAPQFQKYLNSKPCYACAKGSALAACVRRFDKRSARDFGLELSAMWSSSDDDEAEIKTIFGGDLMEDMEEQFENAKTGIPADKRLIQIMGKIVKSGGKTC